jgi:F-type H+-transporting ATPase subunit a
MVLRVSPSALKTFVALPLFAVLAATAHAAGGHEAPASLTEQLHVGFPITNSILTSFLITTLLIIGIRLFVGKPKLVPSRGQAVFETLISGL